MLSRLDKDTSGLILLARSIAAQRKALEIQRIGGMRKFYRLVAVASDTALPGFRPAHRALSPDEEALFHEPEEAEGGLAIESYFRSFGERGAMVACVSPDEAKHEKKNAFKKGLSNNRRMQGRGSRRGVRRPGIGKGDRSRDRIRIQASDSRPHGLARLSDSRGQALWRRARLEAVSRMPQSGDRGIGRATPCLRAL